MPQNKEMLLKSLHVCLRLPILIFDKEFNLVEEYRSNRTISFFYNYKLLLKRIVNDRDFFYYINGNFNEMFLLYVNGERNYLFGPFKCNIIDKEFFQLKMDQQHISLSNQKTLYEILSELPLFSLGDVRDILILVHYFFTGKIEDVLHIQLHNYVKEFSEYTELNERIDDLVSQNYDPEIYLFLYENKILEYVKTGDVEKLRDMVFQLSNGIVPAISGDTIRTEKNYSIIVFEKLAQTSISLGMDIIDAYQNRDKFVRKNELAVSLNEVLQIRDASIVFYTKEIGKEKTKKLSPLISSVVQYVGLNIYKKITVKEISEYFSISETKLRTNFKEEMNTTLYNYIMKRKISAAKVMLKSNNTISEVAFTLGFSDSSHLSKVFKKYTGISPKQFQQKIN